MTTRRRFIAVTTVSLGALAVPGCGGGDGGSTGPVIVRIPLPAIGETVNVAGGLGNQGVAVTRLSADSVVAVSRQCTHQQCTVNLPSSDGNMHCPCHGSTYTTSGAVVTGPAVAPLRQYSATIDTSTNEVVITIA